MTGLWLALALFALILELIFGILYFLLLALAFAATGILVWFFEFGLNASVTLAALFSLSGITGLYYWRRQHRRPASRGADNFALGQIVAVTQKSADGSFYVRYRGTLWQARLAPDAAKGKTEPKRVRIVGQDGNILLVEPLE